MNKTNKLFALCLISLSLSVALGAMGAHLLKQTLTPAALQTFQTGIHYHQLLTVVLMILLIKFSNEFHLIRGAFYSMGLGMILFSGNCYLYAITEVKFLVHLIPIGGVLMICGGLWMAFKMINKPPT